MNKSWKRIGTAALVLAMTAGLAGCAGTPLPGQETTGQTTGQTEQTGKVEQTKAPAESKDSGSQSQTEETSAPVSENGSGSVQDFSGVTLKVWGGDLLTNQDFKQYFDANSNGMQYEVVSADEIKLMSMVASGTAPDIWILSAFSHGAMYAARGLYEPLDDYVAASSVFDADNFADVMNLYRFDGKEVGTGPLYGIVKDWSLDNQIWVNKTVFEEAGLAIPDPQKIYSWDDIRDWAKACTKFDADGKQTCWGLGTTNNLYQMIASQLASVGKSMFTDDLSAVNIDTPEVREAFDYWADMYKTGAAVSDISTPGDWGGDSFAADKVGMLCCGYWFGNGTLAFNDLAKDHMEDYILIQAPSLDTANSANACLAGVGGSIWKGSRNKDAAFRFLEIYLGGEWAEKMAKIGFGNPAQLTLVDLLPQETEFQKQTYEANKYGIENMVTLKTNPFITAQGMDSTFKQYFYEVLYERMTMDDAIAGMQKEFTTLLEEGKEICGVD